MYRGRFLAWTTLPALLLSIVGLAVSAVYADIEISRPLDGATVRETVNVLVPVSSVPPGGFVAFTLDGVFQAGVGTKSADGENFIFAWNTKAIDPSKPADQQKVVDGKHTIKAQACDAGGKVLGPVKEISVYVKNAIDQDMPANGLKLRYRMKKDSVTKYNFKYTVGVQSIQGVPASSDALSEIEGAEGAVKKTVEDTEQGMISEMISGTLCAINVGRATPVTGLNPIPIYLVEDGTGRVKARIHSSQQGNAMSMDLPLLPLDSVRTGSTWQSHERVFTDVLTGDGVDLVTSSTLDGLEWENGYPCAKFTSTFSGDITVPFSRYFTQRVNITGERTTYFAYQSGKVISSVTIAKADLDVDQSVASQIQSMIQQPTGSNGSGNAGGLPSAPGPPGMPPGIGGPPGMEDDPGDMGMPGPPPMPGMGMPGMPFGGSNGLKRGIPSMPPMPGRRGGGMRMPSPGGGTGMTGGGTVNVKLLVTQKIELGQ